MNENWIPVNKELPFAEYGGSKNVLATCCLRNQVYICKYGVDQVCNFKFKGTDKNGIQ